MPNHKLEMSPGDRELAARSAHQQVESAGPVPPRLAEIARLYSQIRELAARMKGEPELNKEIDRLTENLRVLQEAEADELERRFEKRLRLKPGTGWAHLSRIRERLGDG
jgi:flagellar motility protein MotE (MotC chaperone)